MVDSSSQDDHGNHAQLGTTAAASLPQARHRDRQDGGRGRSRQEPGGGLHLPRAAGAGTARVLPGDAPPDGTVLGFAESRQLLGGQRDGPAHSHDARRRRAFSRLRQRLPPPGHAGGRRRPRRSGRGFPVPTTHGRMATRASFSPSTANRRSGPSTRPVGDWSNCRARNTPACCGSSQPPAGKSMSRNNSAGLWTT